MRLDQFALRLEKLSKLQNLAHSLSTEASELEIKQAEEKLGVLFPEQGKLFYGNYNGLHVEAPAVEVLPIEALEFIFPERLHFATFDRSHRLCFDTSHTNEAGQWNILAENDFCVTLTMASFWSNKIFAWVKNGRIIWDEIAC